MTESTHDVTVVEGDVRPWAWAQCTCGWVGRSRLGTTEAEVDATQHRAEVKDNA